MTEDADPPRATTTGPIRRGSSGEWHTWDLRLRDNDIDDEPATGIPARWDWRRVWPLPVSMFGLLLTLLITEPAPKSAIQTAPAARSPAPHVLGWQSARPAANAWPDDLPRLGYQGVDPPQSWWARQSEAVPVLSMPGGTANPSPLEITTPGVAVSQPLAPPPLKQLSATTVSIDLTIASPELRMPTAAPAFEPLPTVRTTTPPPPQISAAVTVPDAAAEPSAQPPAAFTVPVPSWTRPDLFIRPPEIPTANLAASTPAPPPESLMRPASATAQPMPAAPAMRPAAAKSTTSPPKPRRVERDEEPAPRPKPKPKPAKPPAESTPQWQNEVFQYRRG